MGKYHPYPEYRASGTEWLGQIPLHWSESALKRLCSLTTGLTPPTNDECNFALEGYPWVRPEDIDETGAAVKASRFVSEIGWSLLRKVKSESTLVCCIGTIGKCGYVQEVVSTNQQITAATFHDNTRFNFYLLKAARAQLEEAATGNVLKILNAERLGALSVVKVPSAETDTIATFLDHETAKIDRLVARQERLIELLKEKRQAVISHAVTKGLNPDAPMKDSGVEWLGEVPTHWKMVKFSVAASIRNGQVDPRVEPYSGYTLIAPNHIESGTGKLLYTETSAEQGADSGKYLCKAGEVIYSKIRPALAKACLSPSDAVLCSADMYPIQARGELINEFLLRFMLTKEFTMFATLASDRVAMPKINREALAECRLPVPPADEQKQIVDFFEASVHKIDTLVEKAGEAITLMQEHRTALISAAVTGKIDVRGWQKPNTEQEETAAAISA